MGKEGGEGKTWRLLAWKSVPPLRAKYPLQKTGVRLTLVRRVNRPFHTTA